jgi:hypothetical protein
MPDGATVVVLVRAEQIVLSPAPAADPLTQPCGRVVDAQFYGHDAVVRVHMEWGESQSFVVRTSEVAALPGSGTKAYPEAAQAGGPEL